MKLPRRVTFVLETAVTKSSIRHRYRSALTAAGLALILGPLLPTPRAVAAQDAAAFVANLGTQGIQALAPDVPAPERFARLGQLLRADFDIPGIGLFALGRYRVSATPQEQQEFLTLYPDFTVRAFSYRLKEYGGASFRVTNIRQAGGETIVNSELLRPNGSRIPLDWSLSGTAGQYRITDVAVAGVSMKVTLRDQFASWIANNGGSFRALLAVLRQQIAQAW